MRSLDAFVCVACIIAGVVMMLAGNLENAGTALILAKLFEITWKLDKKQPTDR